MELLETILVILNIGAIGACLVTVWFNIKIMELQNELNKHITESMDMIFSNAHPVAIKAPKDFDFDNFIDDLVEDLTKSRTETKPKKRGRPCKNRKDV